MNRWSELLETMPVDFGLESIDGKVDIKVHAFTADWVISNMKAINWRSLKNKCNHWKCIAFHIIGPWPIINILIGIGISLNYRKKRKPGEPITRLTPLGWTWIGHINGLLERSVQNNFIRIYNTKQVELQQINSALTKFSAIESVADNARRIMNKDNKDTLYLISKFFKVWKWEIPSPDPTEERESPDQQLLNGFESIKQ